MSDACLGFYKGEASHVVQMIAKLFNYGSRASKKSSEKKQLLDSRSLCEGNVRKIGLENMLPSVISRFGIDRYGIQEMYVVSSIHNGVRMDEALVFGCNEKTGTGVMVIYPANSLLTVDNLAICGFERVN